MSDSNDKIVAQQLIEHQRRLYGFVISIVPDSIAAEDLYQETCLKVLDLSEQFDASRPFMPWACQIAFNIVRNHRVKLRRDRHVFSDAFMRELAEMHEQESGWLSARSAALPGCMDRLNENDKRALQLCYSGRHTMADVAGIVGQTQAAFYKRVQRLRHALAECIDRAVAASREGEP